LTGRDIGLDYAMRPRGLANARWPDDIPKGRRRMLDSDRDRSAAMKLCLCAMAMGALLASSASAQIVEGYIQLPDSLGPISLPYHVAVDYTSGAERFFVGSESGDVIVVDAVNFRKLARIQTGPVTSLCYCSVRNKLYAATPYEYSVLVVDCSTYEVVKRIELEEFINGVFYNPLADRVYCGTWHIKVIDCASDSVVRAIPVAGVDGLVALDSTHNKLYVGAGSALKVVNCDSDSVVATIQRVQETRAICYNSNNDRVYAVTAIGDSSPVETLYTVDTEADSVVDQLFMPYRWWPAFALSCDPAGNRLFAACSIAVMGIDCEENRVVWQRSNIEPRGLACAPSLDRAYVATGGAAFALDGATGQVVSAVSGNVTGTAPVYLERLNRLYCTSVCEQVRVMDCSGDSFQALEPLGVRAYRACLDTLDNKLYFTDPDNNGYLGVADCPTRKVKSHRMCSRPGDMVHDAIDNKLYVSTWNQYDSRYSGLSVFDCTTDSLVKVIPGMYFAGGLCWQRELNRLYGGAADTAGRYFAVVVDCATDSIVRVMPRGSEGTQFVYTLLAPEFNEFWGFSSNGYTIVDCLKDSVIMDTVIEDLHPNGVCYSAPRRKVYVVRGCPAELYVISAESHRPIRTVKLPAVGYSTSSPIHVSSAGKVYGAALAGSGEVVYVADTETDSVVASFPGRCGVVAMSVDGTGRYVYCSTNSETLLVIDTQSDSIVLRLSVPDMNDDAAAWLLPNRRTGTFYVQPGKTGRVAVIRDSVVIGLEESQRPTGHSATPQTLLSRAVPLRVETSANIFDPSGRRVAELCPGLNNIRRLAPGVYFVRGPETEDGRPNTAVRKIVVTRM
jgi:DNA-binding beta-propeller fold protein YncE